MASLFIKALMSNENNMVEFPNKGDSPLEIVEQVADQQEGDINASELIAEIGAVENAEEVVQEMESVVAQQQANIDSVEGNPVSDTVPNDVEPELDQNSSPEEVQDKAVEYTATMENLIAKLAQSVDTDTVRSKLGVYSRVPSSEALVGGSPLRQLKEAHESFTETLKNTKDTVVEWLKKLWDKIKGMFKSIWNFITRNKQTMENLKQKMDEMKNVQYIKSAEDKKISDGLAVAKYLSPYFEDMRNNTFMTLQLAQSITKEKKFSHHEIMKRISTLNEINLPNEINGKGIDKGQKIKPFMLFAGTKLLYLANLGNDIFQELKTDVSKLTFNNDNGATVKDVFKDANEVKDLFYKLYNDAKKGIEDYKQFENVEKEMSKFMKMPGAIETFKNFSTSNNLGKGGYSPEFNAKIISITLYKLIVSFQQKSTSNTKLAYECVKILEAANGTEGNVEKDVNNDE